MSMNNKKILIILSVLALIFLFIGAVSAADNTTKDTVEIKEKENTNEKTISETQIQSTNNNAISHTKKEDESKVNSIQTENTKQHKHKVLINAPAKNFKYKSNSHFKISLKDSNTHNPIKNKKVKIKISFGKTAKSKYYTTNSQGLISLNTKNLKIGVYKVTISIPRSKDTYATSKNTKIVISKYIPTSIIVPITRVQSGESWPEYKLKTGQKLDAFYTTEPGQYDKGIYIGTQLHPGQGEYSNTKLLKAQIYFESQSTGKIMSKIYTKTNRNHDNMKVIKKIKGYTPIKAEVWYKHK